MDIKKEQFLDEPSFDLGKMKFPDKINFLGKYVKIKFGERVSKIKKFL